MAKQENVSEVEELKSLIESYRVVGVLSMEKLPSRQLQQIRHGIDAKIRMSKRSLMLRAIEGSEKKNIKGLGKKIEGPVALIFTNENPFRLFKQLKEKRSPATAKAGDVATKDVVIEKGSTGLPPGPAISTLQKIGLKASVQGGKIAVLQDKVVAKSGEKISGDVAAVLSLLKIEPLEIGLNLTAVYDGGTVYEKSVLDINVDDYISELQKCAQQAINLSINAGYPTKQTIEMMIQKAFVEIKSLCIETNMLEKDFVDDVLMKAIRQARHLEGQISIK